MSKWKEVSRVRIEGAIFLDASGRPPTTFSYYHAYYKVSERRDNEYRERIEPGPAIYNVPMRGEESAACDPAWFRVAALAVEELLSHEAEVAATRKRRVRRG